MCWRLCDAEGRNGRRWSRRPILRPLTGPPRRRLSGRSRRELRGRRGAKDQGAVGVRTRAIKEMPLHDDTFNQHQLRRWMRGDAHRFVRADWRRHVRPGHESEFTFALYERKYSADQPRVPAGSPAGGQWTSDSGRDASYFAEQTNSNISQNQRLKIAAKISPEREAECEQMRREDEFKCKALQMRSCYQQAYLRYSNCLAGRPIPPLFF